MTRQNLVFGILLLMLAGLGFGLFTRSRSPGPARVSSAAPKTKPAPPAKTAPKPARVPAPRVSGAASSAPAPASASTLFDRPLTLTTLGWQLAAPVVLENEGLGVSKASAFSKRGLELRITPSESMADVEHALARGGSDEKGADVAVVSLPQFVASYEALKALDPVMFLIAGWSSGHDVLLSKFKHLGELPATGPIELRGVPGSSQLFLAAFVLAASGVDLGRVELLPEADLERDAMLWALGRDELAKVPEKYTDNVLLSSAEAPRLIPYVAVAQRSLVKSHTEALRVLAEVWFRGQQRVSDDPTGAARRIAKLDRAPEPLELVERLGRISSSSVRDNAVSAGVAGRAAVNLSTLFGHAWAYFRALRVLSTPPPVEAPVEGTLIARLGLGSASAAPDAKVAPRPMLPGATAREPALLLLDSGPRPRDPRDLAEEVAFIAGVFARSDLRLGVYKRSVFDKQVTLALAQGVSQRFGIEASRLSVEAVRPSSQSTYLLEVMPAH